MSIIIEKLARFNKRAEGVIPSARPPRPAKLPSMLSRGAIAVSPGPATITPKMAPLDNPAINTKLAAHTLSKNATGFNLSAFLRKMTLPKPPAATYGKFPIKKMRPPRLARWDGMPAAEKMFGPHSTEYWKLRSAR